MAVGPSVLNVSLEEAVSYVEKVFDGKVTTFGSGTHRLMFSLDGRLSLRDNLIVNNAEPICELLASKYRDAGWEHVSLTYERDCSEAGSTLEFTLELLLEVPKPKQSFLDILKKAIQRNAHSGEGPGGESSLRNFGRYFRF